jgi:hypothetical protein
MLTVIHSIVAGNFFSAAPDVAGLLGAVVDASFSLIGSSAGSGLAPAPFRLPDANGNLVGGATFDLRIDPKLGPLVYNGGPEFLDGSRLLTHALLPGSPAINAGDPAAVGLPPFDQRGTPYGRVVDGNGDSVARIDIGAYEVQLLLGDMDRNLHVNVADISALMTALADLNAYQSAKNLFGSNLLAVADTTADLLVTNADIQGLINLLANGGSGGAGSLAASGSAGT